MKRYVCMMLVLLLVFSTTGVAYANAEDEETTCEAADQIDYLVLVNEENKRGFWHNGGSQVTLKE